jgi:uncharacterized protein (DUF362 family)/NAD-dependent dihydropyrimidine dehydrogenase PreA subunit
LPVHSVSRIVAGSCGQYEASLLRDFLSTAFSRLDLSFHDVRVLLKVNLLYGKPPQRAVNTHPVLVQALAEMLLEKGCKVFVGDSPGYESTERALERSGIMDVIRKLQLEVAPFKGKVTKSNKGVSPYRELVLAEDPLEYDVVINLPKLKTHTMMGLTAGVKNLFGFVPSLTKAKWHLRCGTDKALFSSLLLDLCLLVRPALTVLDGILAMDGDGPGHGRPRSLGLLAASDDPLALDDFLESFLKVPYPLPLSSAARRHGLTREYELIDLGVPEVKDFRMPATINRIDFDLPSPLQQAARRVFTRKPKCDAKACTLCRTCVNVCPPSAITVADDRLAFDYTKCIRCYCCQELCPVGAIKV